MNRNRVPWPLAAAVILVLCPLAGVGLAAVVAGVLNVMGWR